MDSAPHRSSIRPPDGYSFEHGLLGSLHELALRCSVAAICVPLAAGVVAVVSGHRFFLARDGSPPSQPVLTAAMASFVLVPMLALLGSFCAAVVAVALARSSDPRSVRAWRAAFLVAVGAWSLLMAALYDFYLLPDLTT